MKVRKAIFDCLEVTDDKISSPRLSREKLKQDKYRELQAEKGKKGGRPQKPEESHGFNPVKPEESHGIFPVKLPNPNPNPNPNPKKAITPQPVDNSEKEKDASLKNKDEKPDIETEKQELRELVNQIITKYPKLPITTFLQKHNQDHPKAIIHTLKSLLTHEIKAPEVFVLMKYLETTIKAENMNYNAADEDKKTQKFKRDRKPMEALGNIMSGMLKSIPGSA